jgi:hypothetical protein
LRTTNIAELLNKEFKHRAKLIFAFVSNLDKIVDNVNNDLTGLTSSDILLTFN